MDRISIGKEAAIALHDTQWWIGKTHREIAEKQLFTKELCLPFGVFHEAVEKSLGRPVFTHEFGMNYDGICREFLGDGKPPTLQEIVAMIPEEKRLLVMFGE
jgi:hypothetical protein